MRLEEIIVGDRVRKDMGDIESLAESMKRHGLLHPVVVKKDGTLIAGHRRLEAARHLGWDEIAVTVIDVRDLLSAERDENMERKDFTPTEAVAIGRLIEEQHRAKIESQRSAMGRQNKIGKDPENLPVLPLGDTREVVGKAVGMSGVTYTRARAIVAAAESDPETFGDLPARMDETSVNTTHKELERRQGKQRRHIALRKLAYPKPNREAQRAVDSLEGICICLRELPVKQLDANKTKEWAKRLKKAASTIAKVAKEIDRVKAE